MTCTYTGMVVAVTAPAAHAVQLLGVAWDSFFFRSASMALTWASEISFGSAAWWSLGRATRALAEASADWPVHASGDLAAATVVGAVSGAKARVLKPGRPYP